jgi:type IV secretion/conjugal transfer VirB4 family ATPase
MNDLFQVRETFSVYSLYTPQERSEAFKRLEARGRNFQRLERSSQEMLVEVEAISTGLQNGDFSQFFVWLAIEVFGDDLDHLQRSLNAVTKAVENNNFTVARETVNQEATFWMRFPGMEHIQPRKRECTSENAAHLTIFPSVGEGLQSCTWGDCPIVHLPTVSGSVYSCVLHQSTMDKALGNALVIGGSEVGKTTVLNFLGSNCFRYPKFRILAFDKRQGMYVWTTTHDGLYLSNQDVRSMQMNPLQMPATDANRTFLVSWLNQLTGELGEDDRDALAKGLVELLQLAAPVRNLKELHPAVLSKSPTAAKRLEKWLPDGSHGEYFNGAYDAVNLQHSQLVTCDMTLLLDRPDILGPVTSYLFHRNLEQADGVHGYMVIVDEIRKYLEDKIFADHMVNEWCEIRKNGGVIVGMAQTAKQILNFAKVDDLLSNTATFILFPEPKADSKDYIGKLGLNETEFAWIKKTSPTSRQALLKRRRGESVMLDLDLSRLGPYMKAYNSGTDVVRQVKDMKVTYGEDWKTHFFGV